MDGNRRRMLSLLGSLGLLGPLMMFAGDMLLYYRNVDMEYFGRHFAEIMRDHGSARLAVGGLLGPIAAVFYMASFLLAVLLIDRRHRRSRIGIFVVFALMMSIGGAYHAQFPMIAFQADAVLAGVLEAGDAGFAKVAEGYLALYLYLYLGLGAIAWLWYGVLVGAGRTRLPRWAVLLTPWVWFWLSGLVAELPQPLNIIVAGGWYNLSYLPLFSLLLIVAWTAENRPMDVEPSAASGSA